MSAADPIGYLRDVVFCVRKLGAQAEDEAEDEAAPRGFEAGRAAAFREVLGILKTQAALFGVDEARIGLGAFDPTTDALDQPRHHDLGDG